MNQSIFIIMFSFFTLVLSGCVEKTASKSKATNSGTNPGTALDCSGERYWTVQGCTGYCQYQPSAAGCNGTGTGTGTGTTTGTTAGGGIPGTGQHCTTNVVRTCSNFCKVYPQGYGCLPNGTNCNITNTAPGCPGSSTAIPYQWGVHYPGGTPTGSCSTPYPVNGSLTSFDVRKATLTGTGLRTGSIEYNPLIAGNYLSTSPMLKSVDQAKVFFMTDAMLKVRLKVMPQPESRNSTTVCYNREPGTTIPGYTKLQYHVNVYGVTGSSISLLATLGPYTTGVNSCSQAIDLSYYKEVSPGGVVIGLNHVKANQDCNFSGQFGFTNCDVYRNIRSFDCWSVEFEVAADGTKTFD